ncbi:Sialidase precursor [Arcanobacterium haemolyticum]|uniref:sialidase family protein n=1 Tax=Arcanobacterium haemolyticum TaxID=28264 RepID=UPI000D9B572D|nr:sialidase family protein [Arcanobacterium haemolyticum]SPT75663.1 Sialidase precursor [Arcanobacterium haemolyticum]
MRKFTSRLVAGVATMGLLIAPALPASAETIMHNNRELVNPVIENGKLGTIYMAVLNGAEDDTYQVGETINVTARYESAVNQRHRVKASSKALQENEVSKCSWRGTTTDLSAPLSPIKARDKYWCWQNPAYTITEKDLEAGKVTLDMTFTALDPNTDTELATLTAEKTIKVVKTKQNSETPENDFTPIVLAKSGDANFPVHRIPALAKAPNGDLLAAWDGRPNVYPNNDSPNPNTILLRVSKNNGETWGPVKEIAAGQIKNDAEGKEQIGFSDPSFVVDYEKNRVFAFFVKSYNKGIAGSQCGADHNNRDVIHAAYTVSDNNGETWSEPKVITEKIVANYTQCARFAASGQGIQLKYGTHKGRLIQQYTIVDNGHWSNGYHKAVSLYSDDHGENWQIGEPVGGDNGNAMDENKVVELSNGDVLLSSRRYETSISGRHYAISKNGGESYELDTSNDMRLKDPRNNASILRAFPDAKMNSALAKVILSSHANSNTDRVNGVVSYSFDDGKTWKTGRQFKRGTMQYSTMTPLGNGEYGILFEGEPSTINYKKVDLNWISPELAKYAEEHKADLGNADSEAAEKIKKLEDEIADLKAKLEAANQAKDEAEKAAKKAEEEKRDADLKKAKAETAKREVEAKLKKAEGDKADLEKRVAELERDIAKAEEAKKAADKAVKEANAAKKKAEEEVAELKAKNAELEKKLKEAGKAENPLVPLTPAEPEPQPAPAISMVSDKVAAGSQVVFTGTGFTPDTKVKVAVHSTVVELGEYVADKDGKITVTWTVPAGFELGAHKVIFTAGDKTVEKSFTVVAPEKPVPTKPAAPGLAKTGVTLGLVAGLAALSIMAGVVAVRRRHEV